MVKKTLVVRSESVRKNAVPDRDMVNHLPMRRGMCSAATPEEQQTRWNQGAQGERLQTAQEGGCGGAGTTVARTNSPERREELGSERRSSR